MLKPDSLRAAITAFAPELARDPERLRMWVDSGRVRALAGQRQRVPSFVHSYRLNVVVTDWTGHPAVIFMAVLDWVARYQPDLVASQSAPGFAFEADILDSSRFDLSIDLDLTETVGAVKRPDGGFDMTYHAEPVPLFDDDEPIGNDLVDLWWQGERLLPAP